jgi:hypothetical protein
MPLHALTPLSEQTLDFVTTPPTADLVASILLVNCRDRRLLTPGLSFEVEGRSIGIKYPQDAECRRNSESFIP